MRIGDPCVFLSAMRAICIARHPVLSQHLCSVFREMDIDAIAAVGFEDGMRLARTERSPLVLCEYDLLVAVSLDEWARDEYLRDVPIVAVSLTRRPEEVVMLETTNVAGFLYLPTLCPEAARRLLSAATGAGGIRSPASALRWIREGTGVGGGEIGAVGGAGDGPEAWQSV